MIIRYPDLFACGLSRKPVPVDMHEFVFGLVIVSWKFSVTSLCLGYRDHQLISGRGKLVWYLSNLFLLLWVKIKHIYSHIGDSISFIYWFDSYRITQLKWIVQKLRLLHNKWSGGKTFRAYIVENFNVLFASFEINWSRRPFLLIWSFH